MDLDIYNALIEYLENHTFPSNISQDIQRSLKRQSINYFCYKNELFKKNKKNDSTFLTETVQNMKEIHKIRQGVKV